MADWFTPGDLINPYDSTREPLAACVFKPPNGDQNLLYLFWAANDDSNSIYFSRPYLFNDAPAGDYWVRNWVRGRKINTIDSTPNTPAACVFHDRLYLFWKANDASNAIYFSFSTDGENWRPSQKINTADSTSSPPVACVFRDQLYLFWRANDASNAIYFSVSGDGLTLPSPNGQKINVVDSTPQAPAACVFGQNPPRLYLFWCSSSADNAIYFSGCNNDGVSWPPGSKINTNDSTQLSPAACVFRNQLYLFWRANDNSDSFYVSSSPSASSWPPGARVVDQWGNYDYSPKAPSCCAFDSIGGVGPAAVPYSGPELFLFWKADDPRNRIYFSELVFS